MYPLALNNLITNMNIYDLIIYYVIYSFLGWCAEVGYAYRHQKKFVNRGFLHGPLCPIYGAAILSVIITLNNFRYNMFFMLLAAIVLTSFVEYFTGLILEKLFKTKYWDYTDDPLNLHGRICLPFSVMWGVVCLLIVKIIHPFIISIVLLVPESSRMFCSIILLCYLFVDFTSTLHSLVNFKEVFYRLQLDGNFQSPIHIDTRNIQNFFQEIRERINNILKND